MVYCLYRRVKLTRREVPTPTDELDTSSHSALILLGVALNMLNTHVLFGQGNSCPKLSKWVYHAYSEEWGSFDYMFFDNSVSALSQVQE